MARGKNDSICNDIDIEDDVVEPSFSDPEDFVDDVDDEELLGDIIKDRPKEAGGFDSIIVVDGMPKVAKEKKSEQKSVFDKLRAVIRKIYDNFGAISNELWPADDNNVTKGYAFFEYDRAECASEAVKRTNAYRLDKNHTLIVNSFTDFEKYMSTENTWSAPEPQPFPDLGNLQYFLQDTEAFDQYVVLSEAGVKTSVMSNSMPEPSLVEERKNWTEKYVKWSPLGTYLTTLHNKGVALWGGQTFRQIMRFHHPGVEFIDFSPMEKYLVTFSPVYDPHAMSAASLNMPSSAAPGEQQQPQQQQQHMAIVVWDVASGKMRRSFSVDQRSVITWPALKWSANDRYFARQQTVARKDGPVDTISIFETPSCGLLDKRSVEVIGLRDFSWSPTDCILCYWVGEVNHGETPARVTLLKIPSREILRTKNLFSVIDLKLHWQKSGDHLCVKVDRYTRAKREKDEQIKYVGVHFNFDILHMRDKNVPVDSIELKEKVLAFSWEPCGNKFAVVTGGEVGGPSLSSNDVSIYCVTRGAEPVLLKKFTKKLCSHLFWSPRGQHLVLAGLYNMNGVLEFVDTNELIVMGEGEHFMCTDIEWDPSGRYVVTAVSWWGHKVDNGYWLWSCQGKILARHNIDRLCNVQWRPRSKCLLSEKQIKNIRKNLQKYSMDFDIKDKMRASRASKELIEKRRRLISEFEEYRAEKKATYEEQKAQRIELRNGVDCDSVDGNQNALEEECVEMIVKKEVTIIG